MSSDLPSVLRGLSSRLSGAWPAGPRIAPGIAAAVAIATLAAGLRWGTFVVGGSDSHCYVGQAQMFAAGRLSLDPPIPGPVPWPDAAATFVPAGFTPMARGGGKSVPMCPAGLSLLMAVALMMVGEWGLFLVVPMLGAAAVWWTYALGRDLDGPASGLVGAVLTACSPIVLYQLVQPMSDVPAMAWWTGALAAAVRGRPALAGLAVSAAIMTRPNLAPLAVVPAALAWWQTPVAGGTRNRLVRLAWFASGAVPGVLAVAWIQNAMYGSPFSTGYGGMQALFSSGRVAANLERYPAWLVETHTPIVALALAAPIVVRRKREALLLLLFALGVLAAYLPYVVFEEWWYLRFLLPGLPVLFVLLGCVAAWGASRLPALARAPVLVLVVAALGATWLHTADQRLVFTLKALEQKYAVAGRYVATRVPPRAVVIAGLESGSVRYYSGRPTLSWDGFQPAWLDPAIEALRERGYAPYLALDASEEDAFRRHFHGRSRFAALDWPPAAQVGIAVRLYDLGDRARYLAGEPVHTVRLWPERPPDR